MPGLTFTGLPDVSVLESRDRIRAAVLNSGLSWPNKRITVALLPADVRKYGSMFDVALAVSVLAAAGEVPAAAVAGVVWLAELGLDGRLRPVRGALPAVLAAREAGRAHGSWWHRATAAEAALVTGLDVLVASSLAEIVLSLRGGSALASAPADPPEQAAPLPDLADVVGQPVARRALEIAAAGAHHLLLEGVPGAGKTMLAERLPSILPELEPAEALEVTAIHSVAGRAARRGRPAPAAAAAGAASHLFDGGPGRWWHRPRPSRARRRWPIAACWCSTRRRSSSRPCSTRCANRWNRA